MCTTSEPQRETCWRQATQLDVSWLGDKKLTRWGAHWFILEYPKCRRLQVHIMMSWSHGFNLMVWGCEHRPSRLYSISAKTALCDSVHRQPRKEKHVYDFAIFLHVICNLFPLTVMNVDPSIAFPIFYDLHTFVSSQFGPQVAHSWPHWQNHWQHTNPTIGPKYRDWTFLSVYVYDHWSFLCHI